MAVMAQTAAPLSANSPDNTAPSWVVALDAAMCRVLCVTPAAVPYTRTLTAGTQSTPPFGTPLLVSALRCIVRYVLLPFVLPLIGIATGVAFGVGLALDVVAAVSIVTTLRQLWRLQHPRRWQYLPMAAALVATFVFFLVSDVRYLQG